LANVWLTSLRLLALPLCASYGWQAKEGCSPRAPKLSRKAEAKAARLTSSKLLIPKDRSVNP